ncbi:citrate synthase [Dunaliella salina]|uniref:Citrate synthase n=1 Tax=Dunaliella salina TaxID=3046 RepID=A0ABQ7GJD8_DUNSA|nr:citrate synthase [Dunaliella salina]|eukprot:KAF5834670.1 citrate synthase [Dunaliella salina]
MLPKTFQLGRGLQAALQTFGSSSGNHGARFFAGEAVSVGTSQLRAELAQMIPEEQAKLKAIKKEHGSKLLGNVTVDQVIGGMRGIPGLLWETSLLDPDEGIRLRGYSLPELQEHLPKASEQPLPEGLLWLLLTGKLPTKSQTQAVIEELRERSKLPDYLHKVLAAQPAGMHPMTQFSSLVLALQRDSKFAHSYAIGVHKSKYWEMMYEDSMNLIAKLPQIAAMIYRKEFKNGDFIEPHPQLDWAANLSYMMGYQDEGAYELSRLYQTIHSDHEGGNVSAHATHLVGSALSDPYLSFSAGLNGLAGPLHGLANQEVLNWLENLMKTLGENPTKEELTKYVEDTLSSGKVVPGYGHAVLRKTDPRYTCQRDFALKHLPDYAPFKLVSNLYDVVPKVLLKTGKVCPCQHARAHWVALLYWRCCTGCCTGKCECTFIASCALVQGIWSRALGLPIERPKSLTSQNLVEKFGSVMRE